MAATTSPKILAAVRHLVSTRGLDEVSVRTVATEAGVSIGAVQHHFHTKSELLAAAMQAVTEEFVVELSRRLGAVAEPAVALREFLSLLAGVDEDVSGPVVWVAFAARACVDPAIREIHTREWKRTEEFLRELLDAAHPGASTDDLAATLLALADGIAVARAAEDGRMSSDRAQRLVDAALATLVRGSVGSAGH